MEHHLIPHHRLEGEKTLACIKASRAGASQTLGGGHRTHLPRPSSISLESLREYVVSQMEEQWEVLNHIEDTRQETKLVVDILSKTAVESTADCR